MNGERIQAVFWGAFILANLCILPYWLGLSWLGALMLGGGAAVLLGLFVYSLGLIAWGTVQRLRSKRSREERVTSS